MNEIINKIRQDFPILNTKVNGKNLVYLDNAATTQKPKNVIDVFDKYYTKYNANVHRGVHYLSELATKEYENSRNIIKNFINAKYSSECIITKGTTESINLVAKSFGSKFINEGDEILISHMEHHSNIVPWQILCEEKKATLKIIPILESGDLDLSSLDSLLSSKTKLVSVVHVSNILGTINPIKRIIQAAHAKNIPVLVDGAQATANLKVDVQDLDCDFYAFSAHKMYGPMGIGCLYGKKKYLEQMPPFLAGGDMILSVNFEKTVYNELPFKFEAGTPPVPELIGFSECIKYLQQFDSEKLLKYKLDLLNYTKEKLIQIPGLKLIGNPNKQISSISFVIDKIHPHDIGTIVNNSAVAIRTGHHCAMPVIEFYKIPATARVSIGMYNTFEEVDLLADSLKNVIKIFKK